MPLKGGGQWETGKYAIGECCINCKQNYGSNCTRMSFVAITTFILLGGSKVYIENVQLTEYA